MSLYHVFLPRNPSLTASKCCWCLTVDRGVKIITGLGIGFFTMTLFHRIFSPAVYYYAGEILFLLNCAILAANITLSIALFTNVFQDKSLLLILWLLFNLAFFLFVLLELILTTVYDLKWGDFWKPASIEDFVLTVVLLVFYMHFILVMLKYYKGTAETASTTEAARTAGSERNSVLTIASRTSRLTAASTSVMITEEEAREPAAEAPAPTDEVQPEVQDRRKSTGILAWLSR